MTVKMLAQVALMQAMPALIVGLPLFFLTGFSLSSPAASFGLSEIPIARSDTSGVAERAVRTVSQASPLPEEPVEYDRREIEAYYDWRNDLFFRRFDMQGTGVTDFMTARRTYRVWLDEFSTPVAVTMSFPLFYWVDLNRNGEFEPNQGEMWSDPEEDGINGNERPYEGYNPQGGTIAGDPQRGAASSGSHRPLPDPRRWR
jgi:hypothetical protein